MDLTDSVCALSPYYDGLPADSEIRDEIIITFLLIVQDYSPDSIPDVDTAKLLVKFGSHVLDYDASLLDGFELRLIRLGESGTNLPRCFSKNQGIKVGHLLSYLADLKTHLGRKSNDPSLLEQAYFHRSISSDLTTITPKYSTHALSRAGDIAVELFEKTRNVEWLIRAYQANSSASGIGQKADPRHAAYCSLHAGEHAEQLAGITSDSRWEERAVDCYKQFIQYTSARRNQPHSLRTQSAAIEERIDRLNGDRLSGISP